MIDIETWAMIRHLSISEKMRVSDIARQFGIARETVRKALQKETFVSGKCITRSSLLDPYKDAITKILDDFPDLSAIRILEKIREKGYQGQITILRELLGQIKARRPDPYLRLSVPPGLQGQVDWGYCGQFAVGQAVRPLYCFAMVLSFSRAIHLEFTMTMSMEVFLEAHIKAFEYFHGCPKEVLYDNLSSVVTSRVGTDIRFNPRFLDFSGFYGFKPKACNVRKAREKGRIEMVIKYIKRNFLAGRTFTCLDDVRRQSLQWRDEIANVRIHSVTRQRPVDLLDQERPLLIPLSDNRYDTSLKLLKICPPDAFLRFQTNDYSVPFSCVGRELLLKVETHMIRIFDGISLVAEHARSWEKNRMIENPEHRKELIARRSRATFSKAFQEIANLGPECSEYLDGLNRCDLNVNHHVMRLLSLCRIYGSTELRQAISHALSYGAFGADYIENIIVNNRRRRYAKPPTGPIQIHSRPDLCNLDVLPHSLTVYETLDESVPENNPIDLKEHTR